MITLVTVITPAYNSEKTILDAVRSVLSQTVKDLEILVIDDCSTDSTPELAKELAAWDDRLTLLHCDRNEGVAAARNRGLAVARGESIAFLDSDDTWELNKLEKQLDLMERTGCDLCYTSYDFMDMEGSPVGKPYNVPEVVSYQGLLAENVVGLSTVLLKREALGKLCFDGSFFHEDLALWLSLLRGGAVARGIPEVLAHYRTGGRSANKLHAARNRWEIYRRGEGFGFAKSAWWFGRYALAAAKKYL